jgi:hypothetical protein
MTKFYCSHQWRKDNREEWEGTVTKIQAFGSHYEIFIESRSSIRVLLGGTALGFFACIPDRQAGCWLSVPEDLCYNSEKLSSAIKNTVDGITVAYAYKSLSGIIRLKG